MPSLIDKIDSLASAKKHVSGNYNPATGKIEYVVVPETHPSRKSSKPSKSYSGGSSLFSWGYTGANHDLRADEYGAAQAVAIVTEVQRAVQFWQQWLSGLTWHLYDGNTDKILTSSTDRKPPQGNGALWFQAVKRFPEQWKHDFFESIAFSDWVWGETYIGKLRNQIQVADFMWLNPLGTEPDIMQGRIRGYRYSGDEGYYLLDVNEVAYRIAQRNPLDDWRGLSPVLNAIDKINLTENVHRSLNGYYRRHMQLGGVVSGKPNEAGFSIEGTTVEEIKDEMRRKHQGAENAFGWFFSNAPVEIQQFQPLDIEKNYAIVEPLRKQIAHAMGVPPVLSGDPTEVNYDNADKVMRNWWQTDGIPYARKVANFVNRQLLPDVEPNTDMYFGFDFTDFEIEDPETVSTDFTSQIIPINIAQQKRGYEVDEALKDIYMVNGVPMHRDLIVQKAREGLQESKATSDSEPQALSGDVAIPTSEIFGYHIDAGIVDVNEARAQLGLPPKKEAEVNELQELQAKLAVMVTAYSAGIPTEISAQMVGLDIPIPPPASPLPATEPTPFMSNGKSVKADARSICAYIPLVNNVDVLRIQRQFKEQLTDKRIEWQTAPTLHVTLCLGELSDSAIQTFASTVISEMQLQPASDNPIAYFETPNGKALHIALDVSTATREIQEVIYQQFWASGQVVNNDHFESEQWKPHITLAYIPNDVALPDFSQSDTFQSFVIKADTVIIGRDDYDPVLILTAPKHVKHIDIGDDHHAHLEAFEPKHATYDDELQAWKRFAIRGKSNRAFEPYWLRGDIGDSLQDALLLAQGDKDLVAKAFHAAQEQIDATFKALSATRIDFEEDFNSLIKKAMAENNFGRVQWSSAMRAIIRRYGRRVYADGLIEGGVLDGTLSEEDENELASLIASQSSYVSNLGAALYRDETVSPAMADQKAELWFNRSLKPFYEAGLLSADANGVYEFAGTDGANTCSTCRHLKGQRHRLKTWARRGLRPGTDGDNYECEGWKCSHFLRKVFARERGNWLG